LGIYFANSEFIPLKKKIEKLSAWVENPLGALFYRYISAIFQVQNKILLWQ